MTALDPRALAALYKPSPKTPVIIDVPPMRFLQLSGVGGIAEAEFQTAIGTLFALAYPVKFAAKKRLGLSYKVSPLEGIYHDPVSTAIPLVDRERLQWRLMIMLPDEVSGEFVDEVREKVISKKNPPRMSEVIVQTFSEGPSVQIMHIGPYADELPTVERLIAFAEDNGYDVTGDHHEIYIGDPNRADLSKLKTVVRYGITRTK
ncbi:MAG: hypothetical protein HGB10_06515 [Coriobacteriia bacterium]|nr:hypothetical protein [Coriobacteriia bacterium]